MADRLNVTISVDVKDAADGSDFHRTTLEYPGLSRASFEKMEAFLAKALTALQEHMTKKK